MEEMVQQSFVSLLLFNSFHKFSPFFPLNYLLDCFFLSCLTTNIPRSLPSNGHFYLISRSEWMSKQTLFSLHLLSLQTCAVYHSHLFWREAPFPLHIYVLTGKLIISLLCLRVEYLSRTYTTGRWHHRRSRYQGYFLTSHWCVLSLHF